MDNIADLDKLIEENLREFELGELRRHQFTLAEREKMLTETLGPRIQPLKDEAFVVGDTTAGATPKSVWFEFRRIHFATIVSVAVGELRDTEPLEYCVDINCTLRRSYRIRLPTIQQADNFLVGLSRFASLRIVPTVEEEIREQQRLERMAVANEADAERRQRRLEFLAIRQQQLLENLIQIECAPRVAFGVIF